MPNHYLRLLVLLLLLSAQSFSMAHELGHSDDSDNGVLCEICSAGHGFDTAVTVVHKPPVSTAQHEFQIDHPEYDISQTDAPFYSARAPPLNYES